MTRPAQILRVSGAKKLTGLIVIACWEPMTRFTKQRGRYHRSEKQLLSPLANPGVGRASPCREHAGMPTAEVLSLYKNEEPAVIDCINISIGVENRRCLVRSQKLSRNLSKTSQKSIRLLRSIAIQMPALWLSSTRSKSPINAREVCCWSLAVTA